MIKLCKVAKSYRRLYGGGGRKSVPSASSVYKILRTYRSEFEMLRLLVFKLGNVTNFQAFFPVVSTDFP